MSLPDTAEYWNDVKGHFTQYRGIFFHAKGCECGHFHKYETRYISEVGCRACLKVLAEMGNVFDLKDKRPKSRGQKKAEKRYQLELFYKKWKLRIGDKVTHEDYSCENFIITEIDTATEVVTTKGGKNGIWINHASLIIKK